MWTRPATAVVGSAQRGARPGCTWPITAAGPQVLRGLSDSSGESVNGTPGPGGAAGSSPSDNGWRAPGPSGLGRTDSGLGTSLRATASAARTASATCGSGAVSNQALISSSSSSGLDGGTSSLDG